MRTEANYDTLVKELEKTQNREKALKEQMKAAESKKLLVFTSIFEKSYKGDFKKMILDADPKILKKAAESIVLEFQKHLEVAENDLAVGDPKPTNENTKPKKKSAPEVQNIEQPEVKKMTGSDKLANDLLNSLAPNPTKSVSEPAAKNVQNVQTAQQTTGGINYNPTNVL